MVERFTPGDLAQDGFDWYGPAPIPDVRDSVVDEFISQVRDGDAAAIAALAAGPSDRGASVLRVYAERMSSLAVRREDPAVLVRAVVALVAGGLARGDREAIMVMALIEHSARLLHEDLAEIFKPAASAINALSAGGPENLAAWLARAPEDRTLAAMGFEESADQDGFRYRYTA